MQIIKLVYEDGTTEDANFAHLDIGSLLRVIRHKEVETIVVGETNQSGEVVWEKQFSEVTVMPSGFGKPS